MKKVEFRHHYNISEDEAINFEKVGGPSVVVQGQVLPMREMIKRQLYGDIVNKVVDGSYIGGSHDDVDMEKVVDADIIDQRNMVEDLGVLQSEKEENLKVLQEKKKLADAEKKKLADKELEDKILNVTKKKDEGKE